MGKCIVPGCLSQNSRKSNFEQNIKISLHRLPKDKNKRILWLKNIGLHENQNLLKSASICSLHFKEKDINRTLDIITLRENAVPYSNNCTDDSSKQENIENNKNCLNSSSSFVENANNELQCLETSFSLCDNYSKKFNNGDAQYYNEEEICIQSKDEQMCPGCNSRNFDENLNLKISRSTSVSPHHFQEDRDTIEFLIKSFKEYKRKSQQTIARLKRKLKNKKLPQ